MNSISNRYANIDIARGLAALLVVWMHVSEVFRSILPPDNPGLWLYLLADSVDFGRIGVVAFFAVSGFVIPASFKYEGWLGLKVFWVGRVFRLYPAFWLSIPLAIWSTWTIWDKAVTGRQVWANMTIAPALFNELPVEGLYWTLQIELYFYVCCSVLFLLGLFKKSQTIFVVAGLFFIGFLAYIFQQSVHKNMNMGEVWKLNSLYLAMMFWGTLYRAWHDKKTWQRHWNFVLWGLPLTLVGLMVLAVGFEVVNSVNAVNAVNAVNVGQSKNIVDIKFASSHALGLVLFLLVARWRRLAFRPLLVLGEISYALYLFHPIVIFPIYWWAGRTPLVWVRSFPLEFWVLTVTLVSVGVAYAVHRWVERPAIGWGRALTRKVVAAG